MSTSVPLARRPAMLSYAATILSLVGSVAVCMAAALPTFRAGDIAEYTTGFSATIGEIVSGPDTAGFYTLRVPTAGDLPIHWLKLRLLQSAGTPNAPVQAGQFLTVHTGNEETVQSRIVKVNGAWCLVQSPGIVGWIHCMPDPTTADGASGPSTAADAADPPSALRGTYTNPDRSVQLEFAAGGIAHFSARGAIQDCTHRQHAGRVIVRCEDRDTPYTVNPDGTLSGPAESPMARLSKS